MIPSGNQINRPLINHLVRSVITTYISLASRPRSHLITLSVPSFAFSPFPSSLPVTSPPSDVAPILLCFPGLILNSGCLSLVLIGLRPTIFHLHRALLHDRTQPENKRRPLLHSRPVHPRNAPPTPRAPQPHNLAVPTHPSQGHPTYDLRHRAVRPVALWRVSFGGMCPKVDNTLPTRRGTWQTPNSIPSAANSRAHPSPPPKSPSRPRRSAPAPLPRHISLQCCMLYSLSHGSQRRQCAKK